MCKCALHNNKCFINFLQFLSLIRVCIKLHIQHFFFKLIFQMTILQHLLFKLFYIAESTFEQKAKKKFQYSLIHLFQNRQIQQKIDCIATV